MKSIEYVEYKNYIWLNYPYVVVGLLLDTHHNDLDPQPYVSRDIVETVQLWTELKNWFHELCVFPYR